MRTIWHRKLDTLDKEPLNLQAQLNSTYYRIFPYISIREPYNFSQKETSLFLKQLKWAKGVSCKQESTVSLENFSNLRTWRYRKMKPTFSIFCTSTQTTW